MFLLIVNLNGLLSACPTKEQYEEGGFVTSTMLVLPTAMPPDVYASLYGSRDNAYVLHPDLPPLEEVEGRVYFLWAEGRLYRHQ